MAGRGVFFFLRGGTGRLYFFSEAGRGGFFFFSTGRDGAVFFFFFRRPGRDGCFWRWHFFWRDGAKSLHRPAKGGLNRPASRPCKALQNTDCYKHKIKCGRMSASMRWRCLGHLQPFSKARRSLTTMAKKEVCPRDETADPPGMAVLPIEIYSFDEGLVSFRILCGVQSSLVRFAPNRAIAWGPPQSLASLETLCSIPAFS